MIDHDDGSRLIFLCCGDLRGDGGEDGAEAHHGMTRRELILTAAPFIHPQKPRDNHPVSEQWHLAACVFFLHKKMPAEKAMRAGRIVITRGIMSAEYFISAECEEIMEKMMLYYFL